MSYRQQVLDRIAYLQAELNALAALVRLTDHDGAPAVVAAAPVAAAAPAVARVVDAAAEELPPELGDESEAAFGKVRWKYTAGSVYRIVGKNPFRNGNNYNLFNFLKDTYGAKPFTREQLGEAIRQLRAAGKIDSVQDEQVYVIVFMRFAGPEKGAIQMADAAGSGPAASKRRVRVTRKQRSQGKWALVGRPSFHKGSINTILWNGLFGKTFDRAEVIALVDALRGTGELQSDRSSDDVARLFMGIVIDRGLAAT
jgi:hypothetical protein